MPNNNHHSIKIMRQPNANKVSVRSACFAGLMAGGLGVAAMFGGGLSVGSVGIFVLLPVLLALLGGRELFVPGAFCVLSTLIFLSLAELVGFLPPAIGWIQNGLIGVALALSLGMVIALPTALMSGRPRWQTKAVEQETQPEPVPSLTLDAAGPLLVISTTPLGRVAQWSGNASLVPGLTGGIIADDLLRDPEGEVPRGGLIQLANGDEVVYVRSVSHAGEQLLIMRPEVAPPLSGDSPDTVEEAVQARTRFFASLAHDLKSPLNSVIGFAEMMDDEILGEMPAAYKDYPGLIKDGGGALLSLVEDILDYARSEAGTYELELEPVDITTSGDDVLRQHMPAATRNNIKLERVGDKEVLAQADARAVRRIWDNLVSNAIKYSNPGDKVILSAMSRNHQAHLTVTDGGVGMSADDLARISKPFAQGANAKGRVGTGLGLAMVKRLVDLHGGQVMIRTAPGEGTQVSVTLPAAQPNEETQRAAE